MKELRVKCRQCGDRFTVYRYGRERTPTYCDTCREERNREQARVRMARMRAHRR
jgi:predicted nucleic acid-binding Zn ribbon protein